MLSSFLFQDVGEKAGSIEGLTLYGGDIRTPNDLIDYSLELGGNGEKIVFEVRCGLVVSIL